MTRPSNALLRALTPSSFEALEAHLQPMELRAGQVIAHVGDRVTRLVFPTGGLVSLLARSSSGSLIETAMVGDEGVVGLAEVLGSGEAAVDMTVQVDGAALWCSAVAGRSLFSSERGLQEGLWKVLEFQLAEARQSTLCAALHPADSRLARWLLESSERTSGSRSMKLTQEFLAAMLSVQRTTVSGIASQMQSAGLVSYTRGNINLVDLDGLEARACECRAVTRAHRQRLGLTGV